MKNKGFTDLNTEIETPNDFSEAGEPLKRRFDINILISKLHHHQLLKPDFIRQINKNFNIEINIKFLIQNKIEYYFNIFFISNIVVYND